MIKSDPQLVAGVLDALHEVCGRRKIEYFLIGRAARDERLRLPGIPIDRLSATLDVDVVFIPRDWNEYRELRAELIERPGFREDLRRKQRLLYGDDALRGPLPLDMIPAGAGVAESDGRAHWPPEGSPAMNVLGFDDALADASILEVSGQPIQVVSARGLALLKLIAWNDRQNETKDVEDLAFLMNHYEKVIGEDRLYSGVDKDLLQMDWLQAWHRILGRDIGRMIHAPATADCVLGILRRELDDSSLLVSFLQKFLPATSFESAWESLKHLMTGIEEGRILRG